MHIDIHTNLFLKCNIKNKAKKNIDDFDIKTKNSAGQGMVPVINLQPLSFKFILNCLLWNNESVPCKISSLPTGKTLSFVSRGCWRDPAGGRRFWGLLWAGSCGECSFQWCLQFHSGVPFAWHLQWRASLPAPLWVFHSLSELLCHPVCLKGHTLSNGVWLSSLVGMAAPCICSLCILLSSMAYQSTLPLLQPLITSNSLY